MARRRFTEDERISLALQIDNLKNYGFSIKQIAQHLNLKYGTVGGLWFRYIGYKKRRKRNETEKS